MRAAKDEDVLEVQSGIRHSDSEELFAPQIQEAQDYDRPPIKGTPYKGCL